jgi:hypothetical protein
MDTVAGPRMNRVMAVILVVQVATFVVAGVMLLVRGDTRLGVAQILLAGVQAVIYLR